MIEQAGFPAESANVFYLFSVPRALEGNARAPVVIGLPTLMALVCCFTLSDAMTTGPQHG